MGKRILATLSIGVLLLLGFSDCMSALTLDQQNMRCCGSMPCTPANHSQGCCKNMESPETPSILPAAHVCLHPPVVATMEYSGMTPVIWQTSAPPPSIGTEQHSPPELYTLHASLLI